MATLQGAYAYLLENGSQFRIAVGIHLSLSAWALAIGMIICIPLGIWASVSPVVSRWSIHVIGVLRVIPSLAILILVMPYLGLGFKTALVALSILACPPILINTYVAYRDVDPAVVEAARGMGMSPGQVLWWIKTPLAMPVVVAGLRTAAVEVVASATLASFIGAGGLGDFIINGLGMNSVQELLVGAVPVALLALLVEGLLGLLERLLLVAAR